VIPQTRVYNLRIIESRSASSAATWATPTGDGFASSRYREGT